MRITRFHLKSLKESYLVETSTRTRVREGCTPEVSRALGFNGAEVICHPGAIQEFEGVSEPWDFWMFTRRTRAHDNMAYLLGSNWGTVNYDYYPKAFCPGHSFAIDYTGLVLREAPYPAEQVLAVPVDIEALRQYRTRTGHNCWIDVRTEGFKQIYEKPIYLYINNFSNSIYMSLAYVT